VRALRAVLTIMAVLLVALSLSAAADAQNFGRLFPSLPAFTAPTAQELADLAQTMHDDTLPAGDLANTPSIFTYLGQFADHDLTLDTLPPPTGPVDPATLPNNRTFVFDLDSVFGGGPALSPQLYAPDGRHLLLQNPNPNGVTDVPRNLDGSAIIGDPRNDENEVIGQLQVAFIRFHNRLVDDNPSWSEQRARDTEISYWQWVALHDLLPHFVGQDRVDALMRGGGHGNPDTPLFKHATFTPVEFSVAAYRFGHSIVRKAYNLNDDPATGVARKVQVFNLNPAVDQLFGGRQLPAAHQIFWGYFVPKLDDDGADDPDINHARQIDTRISDSLFALPIPGAEATGSNVLAFRNLTRASAYGLPSGQAVARAIGAPVIPAADINPTGAASLSQGTPLWYYVLAEAQRAEAGTRLGPVGSALVAQPFLRVLWDDHDSILHGNFSPAPPIAPARGQFDIGDLLAFGRPCATAEACGGA
jgi:hypothetical protein